MLKLATQFAEQLREKEIAKGLDQMNAVTDHEIGRLIKLHEKNSNIRPEEIQLAVEERTLLSKLIQEASMRMDVVMLMKEG